METLGDASVTGSRVRYRNGLIVLLHRPVGAILDVIFVAFTCLMNSVSVIMTMPSQWIFRGYLHNRKFIWRETSTRISVVIFKGSFIVCKVEVIDKMPLNCIYSERV